VVARHRAGLDPVPHRAAELRRVPKRMDALLARWKPAISPISAHRPESGRRRPPGRDRGGPDRDLLGLNALDLESCRRSGQPALRPGKLDRQGQSSRDVKVPKGGLSPLEPPASTSRLDPRTRRAASAGTARQPDQGAGRVGCFERLTCSTAFRLLDPFREARHSWQCRWAGDRRPTT
jgi:hypothetical protein